MGILKWGIHRGTLMSRDIGDPYECKNEKEAIKKAQELSEHFKEMGFGYVIWFAEYYPNKESDEFITVHPGNHYY